LGFKPAGLAMSEEDDKITEIMLGMVRDKAKQLYSEKVISHGVHPKKFGLIEKPDGYAKVVNDCGETLEIFLEIGSGRIEKARFHTDGCLFTIAAASAAAGMAEGKRIRDCLRINQSSIMEYLEGMPRDHAHCAFHAAVTLHRALRDYAINSRGIPKKVKDEGHR